MAEEKKLTVLQLLPALESGGVERGTLEIAQALVEHGHRALVMSAGGRLVAPLQALGGEHIAWPIGKKSVRSLMLVPRLRQYITEQKVDVLHARSRLPAWLTWLAWRGMNPATRPRLITTVHGMYSANRYSRIMTRGERVIAVSETVRDYVLDVWPETLPWKLCVIHRGVNARAYPYGYQPDSVWTQAFLSQFPAVAGKLLLTLPGRITRLKGHEDFIEIVRRLKKRGLPVHGLIVGGASSDKQRYLQKLRYRVRSMDLRNDISFTGQRDDMREILAISKLVLSLSTQPESFGRTTLETLRLGVPVAGYAHGGVGEVLRKVYPHGLLPLGDTGAAAARIASLLQDAPPVPDEDFFPLRAMQQQTLNVYEQLASAPRR